ncbi:MAG: hypothetical protein ACE5I7_13405 [Candidatus Binatia bacterium]
MVTTSPASAEKLYRSALLLGRSGAMQSVSSRLPVRVMFGDIAVTVHAPCAAAALGIVAATSIAPAASKVARLAASSRNRW